MAFLSDLSNNISTWEITGYQIILMGDINKFILSKKIRNFATKLGLRELITYRHRSMRPGKTRANNKQQAIDRIWGSQGIKISQEEHLPFHLGPKSDHRLLWIKIPHIVVFGDKNPPLRSPTARRLILRHPRGQKPNIRT